MNHDHSLIVENVLRRLLRESNAVVGGLAALVHADRYRKTAVLYDPTDLIENYESILDPDQRPRFFEDYGVADIIKGVVAVRPIPPSFGPCHGSWQIDYIAGPGWGYILYPIAQALSPDGLLAPDRKDVSPEASQAWLSSLKLNRPRKQFDDKEHDHTQEWNTYHTEDPSDDCAIHPQEDHLNWAYEPLGDEAGKLAALEERHRSTMATLPPTAITEIEEILREEADIFADRYLPPADV